MMIALAITLGVVNGIMLGVVVCQLLYGLKLQQKLKGKESNLHDELQVQIKKLADIHNGHQEAMAAFDSRITAINLKVEAAKLAQGTVHKSGLMR